MRRESGASRQTSRASFRAVRTDRSPSGAQPRRAAAEPSSSLSSQVQSLPKYLTRLPSCPMERSFPPCQKSPTALLSTMSRVHMISICHTRAFRVYRHLWLSSLVICGCLHRPPRRGIQREARAGGALVCERRPLGAPVRSAHARGDGRMARVVAFGHVPCGVRAAQHPLLGCRGRTDLSLDDPAERLRDPPLTLRTARGRAEQPRYASCNLCARCRAKARRDARLGRCGPPDLYVRVAHEASPPYAPGAFELGEGALLHTASETHLVGGRLPGVCMEQPRRHGRRRDGEGERIEGERTDSHVHMLTRHVESSESRSGIARPASSAQNRRDRDY